MYNVLLAFRKNLKFQLTIAILLSVFQIGNAQPGAIDPSFNPTDVGFGYGDGAGNKVAASAIQSDGKIIIGGNFTTYNGIVINRIARLNTDGSLDGSFNPGAGANSIINAIIIQSDGKIIVGGDFTSYNGTGRNYIARLNSNGTLDGSFNPGTGANGTIYSTVIQSDGKIILGGLFTSFNGTTRNNIARLNTDGSLDGSFNPGTGANSYVYAIAIQNDNKIIIGGNFSSYNGTGRNSIARLNSDGSLDGSLNPGTGTNGGVLYSVAIQSDGKIIIGGFFTSYNGTGRNYIARLNADGSLDISFNPGTGLNSYVLSIVIQSDSKIVIGGGFNTYNGIGRNNIARLNVNGNLDGAFNPGTGTNDDIWAVSIQSDGNILIGGTFTSYNGNLKYRITRLQTDGSLDDIFNIGTGANNDILNSIIQNDGKIIVGGKFTFYNGIVRNHIARLNVDGSLDGTLNPGTGANSDIRTIAIQTDGKIIIGGDFTLYNGTVRSQIARLNTDGSLDVTFNPGTGANSTVYSIAIQSDGKILIGGAFTFYNGSVRNRIARLNSDGSLDGTFNPGAGADNGVLSITIQSNGKMIIGGVFTSYNGTNRNYIARLNSDGSLDATFNPGTGANNAIFSTVIQSDGKIIIGGYFTSYNGTIINRIARINLDGSLDGTFNTGTGINGFIYALSLQSDGKIVIGGGFSTYNGAGRIQIARLNANGSLDTIFNPGTGPNSYINSTAIQSDGNIIIGGNFTSYNGTGRNRIARVQNSCPVLIPVISGAATFCPSSSAVLDAGLYTSYLWSGGATTQTIAVNSAGPYSVTVTNSFGCTGSANTTVAACTLTLNLKAYLQGYYLGAGLMSAVIDPVNFPSICDSINISLHQVVPPYSELYSKSGTITTNGNGLFGFPGSVYGNSYYVVVHHRNSMETWSKQPVLFDSTNEFYDFTAQ